MVLNNHFNTTATFTPINLSYTNNFGIIAGIVLANQIITGILLAMAEKNGHDVVYLIGNVSSGIIFILHYAHVNGASFLFIVVAIAITFASLIAMPLLSSTNVGSPKLKILSERFIFLFIVLSGLALLTWVDTTIILGQVCTVILFAYLVVIYPFL